MLVGSRGYPLSSDVFFYIYIRLLKEERIHLQRVGLGNPIKYVHVSFPDRSLLDAACVSSSNQRGRFGRLSYLSSDDSRDETAKMARGAYTKIASYKSSLVAVKMLKRRSVELTRAVKKELHLMKEMSHDNVNRFVGACIDPPHVCILTQYCARGSLKVSSNLPL